MGANVSKLAVVGRRETQPESNDDVRWLALLLMRGMLLIVRGIRDRYQLPKLEERR